MKEFQYKEASPAELERRWDRNIANNPGDERWVAWRAAIIADNQSGLIKTFVVLYGDEPVGEGTLVFSPQCSDLHGRTTLADGKHTVNISALRMDQPHRGCGHMSGLVKHMERYAKAHSYETATIGVEAKEARNLGIYLHWGYDTFIASEVDDGALVLYYAKKL